MDNQNVVQILKVGSSKPHLQVEALKVLKTCLTLNITRVPSKGENQLADYRIID